MTVQDLRDELDHLDGNVEVRFASQPSWPFEYSISEVLVVDETDGDKEIVYLGEGSQIGYLPGEVAEELGW